jgi:hypothetical protein
MSAAAAFPGGETQPLMQLPTTREERDAYVKAAREESKRTGVHVSEIPPALLKARRTPWLVEPVIFPLVERLSRGKLGYCNATEPSLRIMAWVDTGHVYGERSISRRLRQEHKRGRLSRWQLPPGARFKNGQVTRNGTTCNRFPNEAEKRERRWREKRAKQKQRAEARKRARAERSIRRTSSPREEVKPARIGTAGIVLAMADGAELLEARETAFKPPNWDIIEQQNAGYTAARLEEIEQRRRDSIAAAEALAKQWAAEAGDGRQLKPPD